MRKSSFWIVVGEHDFSTSAETNRTKEYDVDEIVVHKDSRGKASMVDIALIRVKGSIDLKVHTLVLLGRRAGKRRLHGRLGQPSHGNLH